MDKDFEVFYQEALEDSLAPTRCHLIAAQVSTSEEALDTLEAMVVEETTLDLLALLTTHAGGDFLVVPIVPRLLTFAPAHTTTAKVVEKKRKGGKTSEGSEKGEIPHPTQQLPAKEPKTTRASQKKGGATEDSEGTERDQCSKPTIWNPTFVLNSGDPMTSKASLRDP